MAEFSEFPSSSFDIPSETSEFNNPNQNDPNKEDSVPVSTPEQIKVDDLPDDIPEDTDEGLDKQINADLNNDLPDDIPEDTDEGLDKQINADLNNDLPDDIPEDTLIIPPTQ